MLHLELRSNYESFWHAFCELFSNPACEKPPSKQLILNITYSKTRSQWILSNVRGAHCAQTGQTEQADESEVSCLKKQ